MLEIESLSAGYGDVQILWEVSLKVEDGEVVALVGSNGAGKSTLLKVISGLLRPKGGEIRFDGQRISGLDSEVIVNRGITQIPEGRRLFPEMSVEENLFMGAYMRRDGRIKEDLKWVYSLFPRLEERRTQLAGSLSGGEQQMCALARGLMSRPQLLMVDEMSLGLAPIIVDELVEVLKQINGTGTTIMLVEQDVQLALENSYHAYVLETGRVVIEGPSAELVENEEVKQAYLGL